jgi:hypothetical protein
MNPAGEFGVVVPAMFGSGAGAEGATAPETLRQMDRRGRILWKAGSGMRVPAASPKG